MGVTGNGSVECAHAFGGVNHHQGDVSGFKMLARHYHREFLGHEFRFSLSADAGRVDEAEAPAAMLNNFIHRIARCARNGRDDGAGHAREPVQQRGLADVGVADDRNFDFLGLDGSAYTPFILGVCRAFSGFRFQSPKFQAF